MRDLADRILDNGHLTHRAGGAGVRGRSVMVNLAESPLAWLAARGHVSARQGEAGERLRADYEMAGLGPRVTMRWDAARARGGGAVRTRRLIPPSPELPRNDASMQRWPKSGRG